MVLYNANFRFSSLVVTKVAMLAHAVFASNFSKSPAIISSFFARSSSGSQFALTSLPFNH